MAADRLKVGDGRDLHETRESVDGGSVLYFGQLSGALLPNEAKRRVPVPRCCHLSVCS